MNSGWGANRGKGKAIAFLHEHVNDPDGDCLIWPMSRLPNGYGMFGYNGDHFYAHRYMCEMANGPPPGSNYETAHSCGRGHDGCIHPKHLSWKTKSGNLLDAIAHGNRSARRRKLKPEQVIEIRRMKGQKTQAEIAAIFGIKEPSVRDIFRGHTFRSILS